MYVENSAALTMNGGGINSNTSGAMGGGVSVRSGAHFTMTGGKISSNAAQGEGGGVFVDKAQLTMSGGEISGNHASINGGGVILALGGQFGIATFEMSGGTITSNTSSRGGGVYVAEGSTFSIKGAPKITGNTVGGKPNNVYLEEGAVITVIDKLTNGAKIGVTMQRPAGSDGKPIPFTSGLSANGGISDPAKVFESDDPDYKVGKLLVKQTSDGVIWEAALFPKASYSVKGHSGAYDGKPHGVEVTATMPEGCTVRYGESPDKCTASASPTLTDAGTKVVYFTVTPPSGSSYQPNSGSATVEIVPAPVVVKAEDKSRVYGEADPELTAVVTGLVNGEPESRIAYRLGRAEGEDAGDHAITPTGEAKQGNYSVTYETGTLTIGPRPVDDARGNIVIAPEPQSFIYDGTAKTPGVTGQERQPDSNAVRPSAIRASADAVIPASEYYKTNAP